MRKRTLSREIALKVLYADEITKEGFEEALRKYWQNTGEKEESVRDFAEFLVLGVASKKDELDSVISKYADNWELDRMATIDRNILRIASFELLHSNQVPPKVAINEAIEMAKKFGDKDSGKFVNGILDKISKSDERESSSRGKE